MLPAEWNAALAPDVPWRDAYATVAREARQFLVHTPFENLSTTELVDKLYPEALARGEGITVRKRIFKALGILAKRDLADCATRGAERRVKFNPKPIRPWIWHSPAEPNPEAIQPPTCPHCGGRL